MIKQKDLQIGKYLTYKLTDNGFVAIFQTNRLEDVVFNLGLAYMDELKLEELHFDDKDFQKYLDLHYTFLVK